MKIPQPGETIALAVSRPADAGLTCPVCHLASCDYEATIVTARGRLTTGYHDRCAPVRAPAGMDECARPGCGEVRARHGDDGCEIAGSTCTGFVARASGTAAPGGERDPFMLHCEKCGPVDGRAVAAETETASGGKQYTGRNVHIGCGATVTQGKVAASGDEVQEAAREVLALDADATAGPWRWWTSNSYERLSSDATGRDGDVLHGTRYSDGAIGVEASEADRAFIARTRTLAVVLARAVLAGGGKATDDAP